MSVSVRFKFSRKGPVRYIGHLDMLRYFQKAVMRSGLPARYSEGFHPHQIMSFAYPLGVSMETEGDYMDLDLTEELPEEEMVRRLNEVMNEGGKVSRASILADNAENAMSLVAAADYRISLSGDISALDDAVDEIRNAQELLIDGGKTKRGGKPKDPKNIRPGIFDIYPDEDGTVFMRLVSGSAMNVRPADVFDKLNGYAGGVLYPECICRLEIYADIDGKLTALSETDRKYA